VAAVGSLSKQASRKEKRKQRTRKPTLVKRESRDPQQCYQKEENVAVKESTCRRRMASLEHDYPSRAITHPGTTQTARTMLQPPFLWKRLGGSPESPTGMKNKRAAS